MAAPIEKNERNADEMVESEEEMKEREHFARIINAFKYYKPFSMKRVDDAEKNFNSLLQTHQDMIPDFPQHLQTVRECIEQNDRIIRVIIQDAEHIFENKQNMAKNGADIKALLPLVTDMDKVKTTLKQFVRDWSMAGEHERRVCYEPVIQEIELRFPKESLASTPVNILVPGAGLGRLTFELARRGYNCQGNEWSLFMLFSSNFVLNKCRSMNAYTLHPWVHQWTNNMRNGDQIEPVTFPDIDTTTIPEDVNFSMAAGDFLEVYQEPESWDCLATVFFIDTAHNIIAYIETIYNILKPGGYWVNLGCIDQDHTRGLAFHMIWNYTANSKDMARQINKTVIIFRIYFGYFGISWSLLLTAELTEASYLCLRTYLIHLFFGPLLYHYSDMPNEMSIELSYAELRCVIEKMGFIFEKEEKNIKSTYTQNPCSMLQYTYNSVFFVVKKPS